MLGLPKPSERTCGLAFWERGKKQLGKKIVGNRSEQSLRVLTKNHQ